MRVEVSVPEADATRTNLTEVAGNLKWEWSSTDQLLVTTTNGAYVGTLNLKEITNEEKTNAIFEGNLNPSLANGELTLNFTYVANLGEDEDLVGVKNPHVVAYDTQTGDFSVLKSRDVITTTIKANKTNNYIAIPDFSMTHYLSAGHFELVFDNVDVELQSVTISGTGLKNKSSLNLSNLNWIDTEGVISIVPAKKDFYVTLAPAIGLDMHFTAVTTDGKTFEGSMKNTDGETVTFDLPSGRYLRRLADGANPNLDASYVGIPIEMKEQGSGNPGGEYGEDDPNYEDYLGEDTRNPLHKFAKYNLTRDDANNMVNVFVDNDEAYGALYQWGRYYGFVDNKSKYSSNRYSINKSTYIQFVEALGAKTTTGNFETWDYSVYNSDGNDYYYYPDAPYSDEVNIPIVVGLDYYGQPEDMWGMNSPYFDRARIYNEKSQVVIDRPYYLMDGFPKDYLSLQRHGSKYPAYVDEYSNSAEYWFFGDDGDKWSDRARVQDYPEDKRNPCPNGWRLPSLSEMEEIIPENGIYEQNGNLANMLNNYCELRKSKSGYQYAIRWNYTDSKKYIEIEAVVLDGSYTNSDQLNSDFWDNHRDDKVVRKFPFTGGIRPYIGKVYGSSTWDSMICRPISMGKPSFTSITWGWMFAIGLVSPIETGNINNLFGGYWVDEKGSALKFCAGNFEREVNGNVRETESEYTRIQLETAGPAFGFAIRPVMDKK